MADARNARRVGSLIGAVVLAAAVGVIAYAWRQNSQTWDGLRKQAERFEPPTGWTSIGQAKQGSGGCFISCDSPRVTIVYRTTANAKAGCEQIRAAVERQVGPVTTQPYWGWCGWRAHASAVGGRAFVTAGAEPASVLRGEFAPFWTRRIPPTGNGTLVWVEFNSGLD